MKLRTQPEPISGGGAVGCGAGSRRRAPDGPQRSGGRRQPLRAGAGARARLIAGDWLGLIGADGVDNVGVARNIGLEDRPLRGR